MFLSKPQGRSIVDNFLDVVFLLCVFLDARFMFVNIVNRRLGTLQSGG